MSALVGRWDLKLLAVGFAVALWLFVMTSEKADLILSAPIEWSGLPPGLALTGEPPESVEVQVHALRSSLSRLSPDQIKARVDLSGARIGEVLLSILPGQVMTPAGITVVRVTPARVRVVIAAAPPSHAVEQGR